MRRLHVMAGGCLYISYIKHVFLSNYSLNCSRTLGSRSPSDQPRPDKLEIDAPNPCNPLWVAGAWSVPRRSKEHSAPCFSVVLYGLRVRLKLALCVLSGIHEACCMRFSEHYIYVLIQAMRRLHAPLYLR